MVLGRHCGAETVGLGAVMCAGTGSREAIPGERAQAPVTEVVS